MPKPTPIRVRRIAAGLRILDISGATGLATTRISEIERGEGRPADDDELDVIEQALMKADA